MDRSRDSKIRREWEHRFHNRPLGEMPEGESKEAQRLAAQLALKSGVRIIKLPPVNQNARKNR